MYHSHVNKANILQESKCYKNIVEVFSNIIIISKNSLILLNILHFYPKCTFTSLQVSHLDMLCGIIKFFVHSEFPTVNRS